VTPAQHLGAGRWTFPLPVEPGRESVTLRGPLNPVVELVAPSPDGECAHVVVGLATEVDAISDHIVSVGTTALETVVRFAPVAEPVAVLSGGTTAREVTEPVDALARDYTARDYEAIRAAMLREIADRTGAPVAAVPETTAVVEALAYLADSLSYAQDALATEAYLATARLRLSVARHAALLGYLTDEGTNARTWVRIEPGPARCVLPRGTALLTRVDGLGPVMDERDVEAAVAAGALVFETVEDLTVDAALVPLVLDEHAHPGARLAPGSTSATVTVVAGAGPGDGGAAALAPGLLVLVAARTPPSAAHVVRLTSVSQGARGSMVLQWDEADALPAHAALRGPLVLRPGNLVLADHGRTLAEAALPPPVEAVPYRPVLPAWPITYAVPLAGDLARSPAAAPLAWSAPGAASVRVREVTGQTKEWHVRRSLLASGPYQPDVVVEPLGNGMGALRFGDGRNGRAPVAGAAFAVRQRVGGGTAGNVAAYAVAHVVTALPVAGATNPVHARGGRDPERLAAVRAAAPVSARMDDRVVTTTDYERLACALPGVAGARAVAGSTGNSPVVTVWVLAGWPAPAEVLDDVRSTLAPRAPAGVAVDVRPAVPLPVDVEAVVAVSPGVRLGSLRLDIDRMLAAGLLAPGRFGFGTPLYRSDVVAAFAAVPGIVSVLVDTFALAGTRESGVEAIVPRAGQVVRLAGVDAPHPGAGTLRYRLGVDS
jgi:hypothetical protein